MQEQGDRFRVDRNIMLKEHLAKKRSAIVKRWMDLILKAYPPETAFFLRRQDDPFANPVGHTLKKGIEDIFEAILSDAGTENAAEFLERIIKVNAVQDLTASQALSFIFLMKKAIREELGKEIEEFRLHKDALLIDDRIDELALSAFDMYMKDREKLYELRADEAKRMTFRLLQKANLITEAEL